MPTLPGFDRLDGKAAHVTSPGAIPARPCQGGSLLQQKVWSHEDLPSGLSVGGGDECDTDLPSWDFSVGQVTGTVYARVEYTLPMRMGYCCPGSTAGAIRSTSWRGGGICADLCASLSLNRE